VAWELLALRYATLRSTLEHQYLRWQSYGEADGRQDLDYFFWLLRDGDRVVAVDTGFSPAVGARRGRSLEIAPADALSAVGVDPSTVETLILTHLDYDHIGNVDLFERATVLVPGSELDFWSGPLRDRGQLRQRIETEEIDLLLALEREGRVKRFDAPAEGGLDLLPGVTAISLPGHSPGQHGLLVQTPGKPALLASDAVHFYAELERERPFAILTDLPATYASYDRIRALIAEHGASLVVGHDPLVNERFGPLAAGDTFVSVPRL
jgi:glyoxylase-like metal-dependent hydrolase (beta-lactamase superfamily II)